MSVDEFHRLKMIVSDIVVSACFQNVLHVYLNIYFQTDIQIIPFSTAHTRDGPEILGNKL
jgi:hypothetical protein